MRLTNYLRVLTMVACCGASACSSPTPSSSATSQPPPAAATTRAAQPSPLVSKVWRQVSPADAPLATLYIFLPDGTLVQTSCTEVYRLSTWRADGDRSVVITEEPSPPYAAEFEAEGDRRLRLRFKLGGEWQPWKTLEVAQTPFVCPDLRR